MTKYLNESFLQNPSSGLHHQRSRREDGASSVSSAAAAGQPSAWRTSVRSRERNVRPRWTLQVFLNVHLSLGHRAAVINWLMLHIHISFFFLFLSFSPWTPPDLPGWEATCALTWLLSVSGSMLTSAEAAPALPAASAVTQSKPFSCPHSQFTQRHEDAGEMRHAYIVYSPGMWRVSKWTSTQILVILAQSGRYRVWGFHLWSDKLTWLWK